MDIQTGYVAWYGAAVATIVLLWDIYKWTVSGPKIKVHLKPNMTRNGVVQGVKTIFVEVTNTGDAGTTITHLVIKRYKCRLDAWLRRNPITQGVILDSTFGPNLPYLIQQGDRWTGGVDQEDLLKKTGSEGVVLCGVYYTHSRCAKLKHLKMRELN